MGKNRIRKMMNRNEMEVDNRRWTEIQKKENTPGRKCGGGQILRRSSINKKKKRKEYRGERPIEREEGPNKKKRAEEELNKSSLKKKKKGKMKLRTREKEDTCSNRNERILYPSAGTFLIEPTILGKLC